MPPSLLDLVKLKLNMPDYSDSLILVYIDEINDYIHEFCNLHPSEPIPSGLKHTWANMVVYRIKSIVASEALQNLIDGGASGTSGSGSGSSTTTGEDTENNVKSFSVDGISMTFVTPIEQADFVLREREAMSKYGGMQQSLETLLGDYTSILTKYRKFRR